MRGNYFPLRGAVSTPYCASPSQALARSSIFTERTIRQLVAFHLARCTDDGCCRSSVSEATGKSCLLVVEAVLRCSERLAYAYYRFTTWLRIGEVLPLKFTLPPYTTVIGCDPAVIAVVASVAFPLLSVRVPKIVVPFLNVTVPVGVPVVDDLTVAVNVTEVPTREGFSEEITMVDVPLLLTFCVSTAEVLPTKLASPP
jgi:hypothetical protein